jgi:hypothetical protein
VEEERQTAAKKAAAHRAAMSGHGCGLRNLNRIACIRLKYSGHVKN